MCAGWRVRSDRVDDLAAAPYSIHNSTTERCRSWWYGQNPGVSVDTEGTGGSGMMKGKGFGSGGCDGGRERSLEPKGLGCVLTHQIFRPFPCASSYVRREPGEGPWVADRFQRHRTPLGHLSGVAGNWSKHANVAHQVPEFPRSLPPSVVPASSRLLPLSNRGFWPRYGRRFRALRRHPLLPRPVCSTIVPSS